MVFYDVEPVVQLIVGGVVALEAGGGVVVDRAAGEDHDMLHDGEVAGWPVGGDNT